MKGFAVNLAVTAILVGISLWCMRKRNWRERILVVPAFFLVGLFLDRMCRLVMEGIAQEDSWEQMSYASLILSKSMSSILLLVICNLDKISQTDNENMKTDSDMNYIEKLTVAGTVFFWCVLTVSGKLLGRGIWMEYGTGPRQDPVLEADFVWTFLLFIILLAFYLSVYIHRQAEARRQAERNRQEDRRQAEAYLYTIENHYQRTRELWHDLRNHISLLHLFLQEEKYEQMGDYLRVFGEEVDRTALPAKSGNLIVDAVLADKTARAKGENIEVKMELCDLTGLLLKPDEICSLLGNLLDNAIEACLKVNGDRKITVTCRTREDEFYISVRNTTKKEMNEIKKADPLISHKEGRENVVGHGLGLRSVMRVVNRYGGEFVTDVTEGIFTAAVRLPGEKAAEQEER